MAYVHPDDRRGQKRGMAETDYESDFPPLNPENGNQKSNQSGQAASAIIIKFTDNRPNFRALSIAERDAFTTDLTSKLGLPPLDSQLLRGGDLVVKPRDALQHAAFLNLNGTPIAGRSVTFSTPNSLSTSQGVIRGVPSADSDEEILKALSDQGVIKARRFPNRDPSKPPNSAVLLTFSGKLKERVRMTSISYPVEVHYPSPFRCRTCWRLGHTKNNCDLPENSIRCKRCGSGHPPDAPCAVKCINCNRSDHEADSNTCPAYLDAKIVLKISITENISVREARIRFKNLFSSKSRMQSSSNPLSQPHVSPSRSGSRPQEYDSMKADIASLQKKMQALNEITIPSMQSSLRRVSTNVNEALTKIANFDSRFDRLEKLLLDRLPQPSDPAQPSSNLDNALLGSFMSNQTTIQLQDRGNYGPILTQFTPPSPFVLPPDQTPLPFDDMDDGCSS